MRNFDAIYQPTYQTPAVQPPKPKRKRRKFVWLVLFLLILGILGYSGNKLLSKTNKIFTNKTNIFVRVGKLILGEDKTLNGEDQGTVNVLLLGMGGPGHDGPLLTDTMIVASLNIQTKEVTLISIPRDFLVQLPKRGYNKINAAYAYAEKDDPGSGGTAAIDMAEKITGLEIPYYAAVDFKGFVKAVDHVGGVDIIIDRTFTDSSYPDYNNGYLPPVTFTKGGEQMDGERALIFSRSRKGTNGEGSDFSRSERQKKIMVAMKDKLGGLNLSDLGTLNNLLNDFTDNFRTNLEPYEIKRLIDLGKNVNGDNVYSISLEPHGDLICNSLVDPATGRPAAPAAVPQEDPTTPSTSSATTSTGGTNTTSNTANGSAEEETEQIVRIYVVQPCSGKTLQDIHGFLTTAISAAALQKEGAIIEIQNTTGKASATLRYRDLDNLGPEIKFTTFKGKVAYDRTVLYDNSKGAKPKTLEYLKQNFNLTVSDVPFFEAAPNSDFVIILGQDSL